MEEKTENTAKKVSHLFQSGENWKGNANGRPKGSNNFKTDWERFVKKVAKSNNLSEEDIQEEIFKVGLKKAREGDFNFYKDLHDRLYGKATQIVEQDIVEKKFIIQDGELDYGDTNNNNLDTIPSTEENTGL